MSVRDRRELLRDAEYFASELAKRLEGLQRCERVGFKRNNWQQAAALTRRIRKLARRELELLRQRDKADAIVGESRR